MFDIFIQNLKSSILTVISYVTVSIITGIPVWLSWNAVASVYFTFLPNSYQHIPYQHIVSVIFLILWFGDYVDKLMPTLIKIKKD
jgi:hypothetical protein